MGKFDKLNIYETIPWEELQHYSQFGLVDFSLGLWGIMPTHIFLNLYLIYYDYMFYKNSVLILSKKKTPFLDLLIKIWNFVVSSKPL